MLVTVAPAFERVPPDVSISHSHWLLVQGEDDEVIEAAGVYTWAQAHRPSPEIARLDSTGHFFHGRLPELADKVATYLEAQGI